MSGINGMLVMLLSVLLMKQMEEIRFASTQYTMYRHGFEGENALYSARVRLLDQLRFVHPEHTAQWLNDLQLPQVNCAGHLNEANDQLMIRLMCSNVGVPNPYHFTPVLVVHFCKVIVPGSSEDLGNRHWKMTECKFESI